LYTALSGILKQADSMRGLYTFVIENKHAQFKLGANTTKQNKNKIPSEGARELKMKSDEQPTKQKSIKTSVHAFHAGVKSVKFPFSPLFVAE
jgi:hypothetical protein